MHVSTGLDSHSTKTGSSRASRELAAARDLDAQLLESLPLNNGGGDDEEDDVLVPIGISTIFAFGGACIPAKALAPAPAAHAAAPAAAPEPAAAAPEAAAPAVATGAAPAEPAASPAIPGPIIPPPDAATVRYLPGFEVSLPSTGERLFVVERFLANGGFGEARARCGSRAL